MDGVLMSQWYPIRMTATEGGSYVIRARAGGRKHILKAVLTALKRLDPNRILRR